MIADSHCHLDYSSLYDQLDNVVNRANSNKVKYLLTICTTLESFEKIKMIVLKYKNIYGTFGIHPHEAKKFLNWQTKFNDREALSMTFNWYKNFYKTKDKKTLLDLSFNQIESFKFKHKI